jgi:hypothetical protein
MDARINTIIYWHLSVVTLDRSERLNHTEQQDTSNKDVDSKILTVTTSSSFGIFLLVLYHYIGNSKSVLL